MVFPDQMRYDWDGFHEPALNLPALKGLAANGTRFTMAYTPSPLCEPARGCIASARDYATSPIQNPHDNVYPFKDEGVPTFYSLLQKAGYHTMLAGKDHIRGNRPLNRPDSVKASDIGFDDAFGSLDKYMNTVAKKPIEAYGDELWNRSSESFYKQKDCYGGMGTIFGCCDDVPLKSLPKVTITDLSVAGYHCPRMSSLPDELYPDNWVTSVAERLLARKPAGKPWFMQLGYLGPHPPFILTPAMNASVKGKSYPPPVTSQEFSKAASLAMRAGYAAEIENIDAQLGKLLAHLQDIGELDNTVVAFMSDHGEMLGDFDLVQKYTPWEGSTHVPLIISGPGLQRGKVVEEPVSTLDAIGTFMDLAGAKPHPNMTASSLLRVLRKAGAKVQGNAVASGLRYDGYSLNWYMVVQKFPSSKDPLKLICCPKGCPFDLAYKIEHNSPPELLLQAVVGKATEDELPSNLLQSFPQEARQLLLQLPLPYREQCEHLLPSKRI